MNKHQESLWPLRRELHKKPEISGEEYNTAAKIRKFIEQYSPDEVIQGSNNAGLICIFNGQQEGPTLAFRAELDALAIPEKNQLPYQSEYPDKGHLCGHDGHMTIVAGLALKLAHERPARGKVILLFQPAEETGEGANWMLQDPAFKDINPDFIFALHNLPGFPLHSVVIRNGIFASASKGMIFNLEGRTSHAAEPERGNSPAMAVSEIIRWIEHAPDHVKGLEDFALATLVHVKIGHSTFGVTPGKAEIMCTLRAYRDEDLDRIEEGLKQYVADKSHQYHLKYDFSQTEVFSATINSEECSDIIRDAAREEKLTIVEADTPFRWSEDFGLFTQKFNGALFGLGAGKDTPDLHNPDYNFPDELITTGINVFHKIIDRILN